MGDVERIAHLLTEERIEIDGLSGDGFTPVQLAAFFGRDAAVTELLNHGANPCVVASNPMRIQALHAAVARGHAGIARKLIDAGADVSARQEGGWTPLHEAAHTGNDGLIVMLLEAGADVSAPSDSGKTPADMARERGYPDRRLESP